MSSTPSSDGLSTLAAGKRKLTLLRALLFGLGAMLTFTSTDAMAQNVRNTTGLRRAGPVDPITHFPLWYEDTTGLRLRPCVDPARCFFLPPNASLPPRYPTNWPVETFYWGIDSVATGVGRGRMLFSAALEGSYLNGVLRAGEEVVFTRIRIRVTGVNAASIFRIVHPYGADTVVSSGQGVINFTRDIGLALGGFDQALSGDVGPFLVPTGTPTPPAPGSYLSDGVALVNVTGSPFGTNFVRIEGLGIGFVFPANINPNPALGPDPNQVFDVVDFTDFTMQGNVATDAGITFDSASITRKSDKNSVDVWARSGSGQLLQAQVDGNLWVDMTELGATGQYYARIELYTNGPQPQTVTLRNLADTLLPPVQAPLGTDVVTVESAVYTMGGDLVIRAQSSGSLYGPALTPVVDGTPMPALRRVVGTSPDRAWESAVGLAAGTPPPAMVTVRSSLGGAVTVPVTVVGTGTISVLTVPVVANAGADILANMNTLVTLNGNQSSGPIRSRAWTHDFTGELVLNGADTATPSFTVPLIATPFQDVNFTLTVTDEFGRTSQDTAIVRFVNPWGGDRVVLSDAGFVASKRAWRVAGRAQLRVGQTISLYLGPVGNRSRLIGTAVVDGSGNFLYSSPSASSVVPTAADTLVWASSSAGSVPVSLALRIR